MIFTGHQDLSFEMSVKKQDVTLLFIPFTVTMLPFVDKTILVRLRTFCFSDIIEKNIWKERARWNASCPKGKKVRRKQ